jgi:hypothetical protein
LPLRPLPAARRLGQVFVATLLLYGIELLARGHWLVAAATVLLAAGTHLNWSRLTPQDAGAARRLLLAADGRLHVHCIGGATEAVALAGESLWLGSTVLLVLQGPRRTHRLLLGPGNLDEFTLATLRRRLRGAAVSPAEPAVDSRSGYRTHPGAIEQITRGIPV